MECVMSLSAHFEVDEYQIDLRSKTIRIHSSDYHSNATIECRGSELYASEPTPVRLTIYFLANDIELPYSSAYSSHSGVQGIQALYVSQYVWIIDLLRNEKPVYGFVSDRNPALIGLRSGLEPVGEHEQQ